MQSTVSAGRRRRKAAAAVVGAPAPPVASSEAEAKKFDRSNEQSGVGVTGSMKPKQLVEFVRWQANCPVGIAPHQSLQPDQTVAHFLVQVERLGNYNGSSGRQSRARKPALDAPTPLRPAASPLPRFCIGESPHVSSSICRAAPCAMGCLRSADRGCVPFRCRFGPALPDLRRRVVDVPAFVLFAPARAARSDQPALVRRALLHASARRVHLDRPALDSQHDQHPRRHRRADQHRGIVGPRRGAVLGRRPAVAGGSAQRAWSRSVGASAVGTAMPLTPSLRLAAARRGRRLQTPVRR